MPSRAMNVAKAVGFAGLGVALAAAGIYIGEVDDAPGAALIGLVVMVGLVVLAVRTAQRRS